MVKEVDFQTSGAATSGVGTEVLSGLTFVQYPYGIALQQLVQKSSGTVANDADWDLYIDGVQTPYHWDAEELNPANVGYVRPTSPIRIRPLAKVQMKWSGQAAAAANRLKIYFEIS